MSFAVVQRRERAVKMDGLLPNTVIR
jgi:hypothetical protein